MPLELAELAGGLPLAASFAMAGGISVLREGRRRTALNEAMHELRRPLQAIALAAPDPAQRSGALESSLRLAVAAVERLDCEINGRPAPEPAGVISLRRLVESAVERWQARAQLEGRALSFDWDGDDLPLRGEGVELAQVLDNLISNGLDHGSGEVAIEAKRVDRVIRLVVRNNKSVSAEAPRRRTRELGAGLSGRRRRGHGLRIVRRVAARNGGSFRLRRRGEQCEAHLELPLAGVPR